MTISVQTRIAAPPERVWAVLSDVRSWPDWLPTVDALEPAAPEAPDGVGASYLLRQPRLPKARWTVTEWRPGEGFTWISQNPGLTASASHEVRPGTEAGTSDVELALGWDGPLGWLARVLFGRIGRDYVAKEARALAARSEAGEAGG
jgi:hypothetical protein